MHENASAHAMVQVKYEDESPARWQCFTHGPDCWTTAALREYAFEHQIKASALAYPSTPKRSAAELEMAKELIAEGRMFCESNIMDGHKATRIGPDRGFYCDEHSEGD